jgi:RNA polymerase sigma-70 factor (ECF subfamily)
VQAGSPNHRKLRRLRAGVRRRRITGVGISDAGRRQVAGAVTGQTRDAGLETLIGAVARGDQAAFEAVCARAGPAVFGVVRDPCQTEEVCQEVLLQVWRAASRFEPGKGSALAWVTTIAHRRAVDRVRAEHRLAERQVRAAWHQVAYDEVAEAVEARLDRERVRRCLGSLTSVQRESVTLAYYGGYTVREVAALLAAPEGTVKTRMRDGLIRLRDCLGGR